jgi:hypothetical protein
MIWPRPQSICLTVAGLWAFKILNASGAQFLPEESELLTPRLHGQAIEASLVSSDQLPSDSPFTGSVWGLNRNTRLADAPFFLSETSDSPTRVDLNRGQTVSLTGGPGETVTVNLRSFVLAGHSEVSLEGTATTKFIINVRKQFSLTQASQVVLSGGLEWDDVIFQINGKGSTVRLSKRAVLDGILVADHRTVRLSGHSIVYGQVMAKRIKIRDAAKIIEPPIVSP